MGARHLSSFKSAARRASTVALAIALGACACAARAADDLPEYRLKAAFLYNFALFTEWPAEVGATLHLCVFGPDPFGAELDGLQAKVVGERSLAVQRKVGIDGLPVLTVADSAGAARQGVALNMSLVQHRISFEANLRAARAAKINLSSKLLRLATEVIQ